MAWLGKLLGGGVGLVLGGPLGGLAGVALGHGLDRFLGPPIITDRPPPGPAGGNPGASAADPATAAQGGFVHAAFAVMGHLAKADGRVSEAEIALAESVVARMQLTPGQRRLAIGWFNEGKSESLPLDRILAALRRDCRGRGVMLRLFLDIQFQMAYADGAAGPEEIRVLRHVASGLGVSDALFEGLDQLARFRRGAFGPGGPQGPDAGRGPRSRGGRPGGQSGPSRVGAGLASAYAVLGVPSSATEAEVKRAYRRLLSQHHPDKLISRGLPPEMLKLADEKTHQIRRAYETITKARAT